MFILSTLFICKNCLVYTCTPLKILEHFEAVLLRRCRRLPCLILVFMAMAKNLKVEGNYNMWTIKLINLTRFSCWYDKPASSIIPRENITSSKCEESVQIPIINPASRNHFSIKLIICLGDKWLKSVIKRFLRNSINYISYSNMANHLKCE